MKLTWIAALILASTSISAAAADQTFTIVPGTAFSFDGLNTLLSAADGSDSITFNGASAGMYNVLLSFSSVNVNITGATLNGVDATSIYPGQYGSVGTFNLMKGSPFVLQLFGTVTGAPIGASYNGQITVTAVPEPETYGMLLGGLALLGVVARRRTKS